MMHVVEGVDADVASAGEGSAGPDHRSLRLGADELAALGKIFAPREWLRDLGMSSWLLLGTALLVAGLCWLLGQASTIVVPVVAGAVVATVAAPIVSWLQRHGFGRGAASAVVLLALVALGVVILVVVIGGLVAQSSDIGAEVSKGIDQITSWLKSVGVDSSGAAKANSNVKSAAPGAISTFTHGLVQGVQGIASLAFGLSFAAFAVFFLLKDGRKLHAWLDGHLGVPRAVAETITGNVIFSVRRYFLGVTIVAAFNAVVVTIAALIMGVPLAGTIGVVTFVTAYIPFIGAVVAGAFAVLLALGAKGVTIALIMLVVVILANGALQNIVQPIAFGATLDLNPLLILVLTIGFGSLFGMVGLILAAPLASAAIHIAKALAQARVAADVVPDG
jgi:predicted PurR-regulated permease PerM